jgi:putative nucleotidyltransferase with HDIG domain
LTPSPKRVYAYFCVLFACVTALASWLVVRGETISPPGVIAVLALLALVAERWSVRLTPNLEISISALPRLFAAVVFGPLPAMVVGGLSMLGDFRPPYLRWAVYSCTRSITAVAAAFAAGWASTLTDNRLGAVTLATLAGVAAGEILDLFFCSITMSLRRVGPVTVAARELLPVAPTTVLLYTAVVATLAYAYRELSPWSLPFFLLPALAAQRLFTMYQGQRDLAGELRVANEQLERANLSFAGALVATLDARDRYTAGHSAAVAVYAHDIAREMGLDRDDQELAHLSGLLHDIGKIGVPPGILEKPGPLTLQERRKMEEHSAIGERILAKVEAYAEIARIVRHHHERIDGCGYPDGLKDPDIPLISKIICVADAYNAMTSDRPYRDAMPTEVARTRLAQAAGTQFDPGVVAAFDRVLEQGDDAYTSGAFADFGREAERQPALRVPAIAAA